MSTSDPNPAPFSDSPEPTASDSAAEESRLRLDASEAPVQRSLLEDVLRETSAAADLTDARDGLDLEALRQIGRRRCGEPFSEDPVAREIVESVLLTQFRDHWNTPDLWRPIAKRIARTLCEDLVARSRLERLWSNLSGGTS
jgi:hypothetical protein